MPGLSIGWLLLCKGRSLPEMGPAQSEVLANEPDARPVNWFSLPAIFPCGLDQSSLITPLLTLLVSTSRPS